MQEPKPDFYAFTDLILEIYDDFEIQTENTPEGSSSEVYIPRGTPRKQKASKSVLAAYSEYFRRMFSETWSGENLEILEIFVDNSYLFSKLINSFHEQNILHMIMNTESCDDKLLLLIMCSEYKINIQYIEILDMMDIPRRCFKLFIRLLNSIEYDISKFSNLISSKVLDIDDLEILDELNYKQLKNYITKTLSYMIAAGFDGTITIWDAFTLKEIKTLREHLKYVSSIAFSPDGRWLISSSDEDTVIIVWDTFTWEKIKILKGHTNFISSIAFLPDSQRIISGSFDGTIKIWDVFTGKEIKTIKTYEGPILRTAFSPDGQKVAHETNNGIITLWDAFAGEEIVTFRGSTMYISSIAFSPDGRRILFGSGDGMTRIWDAFTGKEIRTLGGHMGNLISVAFSPNGQQIISGGKNGIIKKWDAFTGEEIRTFRGSTGLVFTITFSPDGQKIIYGTSDGVVKILDASTGKEIGTLKKQGMGVTIVTTSTAQF